MRRIFFISTLVIAAYAAEVSAQACFNAQFRSSTSGMVDSDTGAITSSIPAGASYKARCDFGIISDNINASPNCIWLNGVSKFVGTAAEFYCEFPATIPVPTSISHTCSIDAVGSGNICSAKSGTISASVTSNPKSSGPAYPPLACWLSGPTNVRTGDKFTVNWWHNSIDGLTTLVSSGWGSKVVRTNDDGPYGAPGSTIGGGNLPAIGAYENICFTNTGSATVNLTATRFGERATCSYTVSATRGTESCVSVDESPTPTPSPPPLCDPDLNGWIDGYKILEPSDLTTNPPAGQPVTITASNGAVSVDTSNPYNPVQGVGRHLQYCKDHRVSVAVPAGFDASYAVCYGYQEEQGTCNLLTKPRTSGNSVVVNIPQPSNAAEIQGTENNLRTAHVWWFFKKELPLPGRIWGRVWIDTNGNQTPDAGEKYVRDGSLTCDNANTTALTVTIAGTGGKNFTVKPDQCAGGNTPYFDSGVNLPPGNYVISVVPPADWSLTTNHANKTVSVVSGADAPIEWIGIRRASSLRPDLLVSNRWFDPAMPKSGEAVTFHGVVRNSGSANAAASQARLRLDIGNNGSWDITATRPVLVLATGVTTQIDWTNFWSAYVGTHSYEICADNNNQVTESDENNNCSVGTIVVGAAPGPLCDTSYPEDQFRACYFDGKSPPGGADPTLAMELESPFLPPVGAVANAINHDWGTGVVMPTGKTDQVSAVWRGEIDFKKGTYVFHVTSDDGVRLDVQGYGAIINEWRNQALVDKTSAPIELDGAAKVRLRWYEDGDNAKVRLWWDYTPPAEPPLERPIVTLEYPIDDEEVNENLNLTTGLMPVDLDWSFEDPEGGNQLQYKINLVDITDDDCFNTATGRPTYTPACLNGVNDFRFNAPSSDQNNNKFAVSSATNRLVHLKPNRSYAWRARALSDTTLRRSDYSVTGDGFFTVVTDCTDGKDNDGDGDIDEDDSGCSNPDDDSEDPECSDGIDNDRDGKIDRNDPGCLDDDDEYDPDDNDESDDDEEECGDLREACCDLGGTNSCNEGECNLDDDSDYYEYCRPACSDGQDNDDDTLTDEDDPGCLDDDDVYDPDDNDESDDDEEECGDLGEVCCDPGGTNSCNEGECNLSEDICRPECSDDLDNDDDTLTDEDDPGCLDDDDVYDPDDNDESDDDSDAPNFKISHNPTNELVSSTQCHANHGGDSGFPPCARPHFFKDLYITSSSNQTTLTITPLNGFSEPVTIRVLGFKEDNEKNSTDCPEIINEDYCADGKGEGEMQDTGDNIQTNKLWYWFDNVRRREVVIDPEVKSDYKVRFRVSQHGIALGRYIIYLEARSGNITKTNEVLLVIGASTPGFIER